MKSRQENNMINHIVAVYVKNDTKLSWPIKSGEIYNENQIGQRHDRSYKYGLCQKKKKLNYRDLSDQVQIVTKTR